MDKQINESFRKMGLDFSDCLPEEGYQPKEVEKETTNDIEVISKFSARRPRKEESFIFKTSFNFLKAIGTYQKGHLSILLGRTNKGKSTLMLSLAIESAINGYKPLIYLAEDKIQDVEVLIENI